MTKNKITLDQMLAEIPTDTMGEIISHLNPRYRAVLACVCTTLCHYVRRLPTPTLTSRNYNEFIFDYYLHEDFISMFNVRVRKMAKYNHFASYKKFAVMPTIRDLEHFLRAKNIEATTHIIYEMKLEIKLPSHILHQMDICSAAFVKGAAQNAKLPFIEILCAANHSLHNIQLECAANNRADLLPSDKIIYMNTMKERTKLIDHAMASGSLDAVKYFAKVTPITSFSFLKARTGGHINLVKYVYETSEHEEARSPDIDFNFALSNSHIEIVKYLEPKISSSVLNIMLYTTTMHIFRCAQYKALNYLLENEYVVTDDDFNNSLRSCDLSFIKQVAKIVDSKNPLQPKYTSRENTVRTLIKDNHADCVEVLRYLYDIHGWKFELNLEMLAVRERNLGAARYFNAQAPHANHRDIFMEAAYTKDFDVIQFYAEKYRDEINTSMLTCALDCIVNENTYSRMVRSFLGRFDEPIPVKSVNKALKQKYTKYIPDFVKHMNPCEYGSLAITNDIFIYAATEGDLGAIKTFHRLGYRLPINAAYFIKNIEDSGHLSVVSWLRSNYKF